MIFEGSRSFRLHIYPHGDRDKDWQHATVMKQGETVDFAPLGEVAHRPSLPENGANVDQHLIPMVLFFLSRDYKR